MQELLVIIAIGVAVLLIPRMMNRNRQPEFRSTDRMPPSPTKKTSAISLPGWMRFFIVISVLWVTGCIAYLKPWEKNTFLFYCICLGPVIALWGGIWIRAGYVKYRR